MNNQLNIFDVMYPKYKITKPIRMITLFSGYDSQCLAMKYINANYESYKTCEWAVKSIQALKDIHFENNHTDYSKELTTNEIKDYLFNKGISSNYNEPMTRKQIDRLSDKQVRTIQIKNTAQYKLEQLENNRDKAIEVINTQLKNAKGGLKDNLRIIAFNLIKGSCTFKDLETEEDYKYIFNILKGDSGNE